MGSGKPRRLPGPVRLIVTALAAVMLAATAYGPGNIASALGFHALPAPPPDSVGFMPAVNPVRVQTPVARVVGLAAVAANQAIRLADGSFSPPDTVYLRAERLELDDLVISQDFPDHKFSIVNLGRGDSAAVAGNDKGSTVELWAHVNSMELCVTAETLTTVVTTYAGVFGGALDEVLRLVADIFAPIVSSPLARVGPCLPLTALLPILAVLVQHGVPLPGLLPAANLDAQVYALKVSTAPGLPSVTAPFTVAKVTQ